MPIILRSKHYFLVLILLIFSQTILKAAEEDTLAKRAEHWKQVMTYGIDSEVAELISQLTEYNDAGYVTEAIVRFNNSNNRELQLAIIDYLKAMQAEEGNKVIEEVILNYFSYDDVVVQGILRYAEVQKQASTSMLKKVEEMLYNDDLEAAAIRLMGVLGSDAQLPVLLDAYERNSGNTDLQADILLAIGELGLPASKDFLYPIAEGAGQSAILRQYAIDALAKSIPGDPEVATLIQGLVTDSNEWIRAYAIYALRFFPSPEANTLIMNALRDEFWRARVYALQSISTLGLNNAFDAVVYKVNYDPEIPVRKEAVLTLASLNTSMAREELLKVFTNTGVPVNIRSLAIEKLLEFTLSEDEQEEILALIEKDWKNTGLIKHLSRTIAGTSNRSMQGIAKILLDYPDAGVQIGSIKSIERNKFSELNKDLQLLLEASPFPIVRSYITEALDVTKEQEVLDLIMDSMDSMDSTASQEGNSSE